MCTSLLLSILCLPPYPTFTAVGLLVLLRFEPYIDIDIHLQLTIPPPPAHNLLICKAFLCTWSNYIVLLHGMSVIIIFFLLKPTSAPRQIYIGILWVTLNRSLFYTTEQIGGRASKLINSFHTSLFWFRTVQKTECNFQTRAFELTRHRDIDRKFHKTHLDGWWTLNTWRCNKTKEKVDYKPERVDARPQ